MIKKLINFLQILAILCIFNAFAINKEALGYLEKLREKEYIALEKVLTAGLLSQQEVQQIIQFYKDFKNIHTNRFFTQKNDAFFHDPKLAQISMGNSNVLEETKKILIKCGINPESISIRYKEEGEQKKVLASVHCDMKNIELLKNFNTLTNNLNSTNFHHELTIRSSMMQQSFFGFIHAIFHEIGHLLEGHAIITILLKSHENYLGGDCVRKMNNKEIFEKFSKKTGYTKPYIAKAMLRTLACTILPKRYQYFRYRQEILADIRMYFFEISKKEFFLNILGAYHVKAYCWSKDHKPARFYKIYRRLIKFFGGNYWGMEISSFSTYKRLIKINQLTLKIPSSLFLIPDKFIEEHIQKSKAKKNEWKNNV